MIVGLGGRNVGRTDVPFSGGLAGWSSGPSGGSCRTTYQPFVLGCRKRSDILRSNGSHKAAADIAEEDVKALHSTCTCSAALLAVDRLTSDSCPAAPVMHRFEPASLDEEADASHRYSEQLALVVEAPVEPRVLAHAAPGH